MRLLLLILVFLPINNCNEKPELGNDISKLKYKVSSRGYYRHIEISENQIIVTNNRTMENAITANISPDTWQSLVSNLNGLDIEKLNSLNTSTDESALDRSLIGELTAFVGENSYTSPMFDHSNPPDKLKGLISQMMALAETVE